MCFGDLGSVSLIAGGGVGTYSYDNNPTTGLTPGIHEYTVSDANGCATTVSVTINAAPPVLALNATPSDPHCFGLSGSVALLGNGGAGGYVYSGNLMTGLSQGNYIYTVVDANGCSATASVIINPPPTQLALNITTNQPHCFGNLGSVIITAGGGAGGYLFNSTSSKRRLSAVTLSSASITATS